MKRIFLLAMLCFAAAGLRAQDSRLEPARDFESYEGMLGQYYNDLFGLLLPGLSDTPVARYVVIPSFSAESVLSLEQDSAGYKLIVHSCAQNLWYSKRRETIKLYQYQQPIGPDLAAAIKTLFSTLAEQMEEPEKPVIGFDGVSYYFTANTAYGPKTGKLWSPRKNTPMARLVTICDSLARYAEQKGPSQETLVQDILELNAVLRQP